MVAITAPHWVVFLDTLRSSITLYDRPAAALFPFAAAPQILLGSLNPVLVLPVLQIATVPLLIAAVVTPRQLVATAGDPGLPRDCDVFDCGGIWCDSG